MRVTYALAVAALVGATQAQEDEPKKPFVVDLPVSETIPLLSQLGRACPYLLAI